MSRTAELTTTLSGLWSLIRETIELWWRDNALSRAAALAFYTIFSLAPGLMIIVAVSGSLVGRVEARAAILRQVRAWAGPDAADTTLLILDSAKTSTPETLAALVGLGSVLFCATAFFAELQDALNAVWGVKKPPRTSWGRVVYRRLLSFAMVLFVGVFLLVSLISGVALSAAGRFMSYWLPAPEYLLQIANSVASFALVTILFAVIYRVLPDVLIEWSDVWTGALMTSLLFTLGKFFIGLYLGKMSPASAFGAAGSLIMLLLWVYYSAQVFLLGAEWTEVWARRRGHGIRARTGAG